MKYLLDSFKHRAHALVHSHPDNATWRTLIDAATERMDLDTEAESLFAATTNALESGDISDYDARVVGEHLCPCNKQCDSGVAALSER